MMFDAIKKEIWREKKPLKLRLFHRNYPNSRLHRRIFSSLDGRLCVDQAYRLKQLYPNATNEQKRLWVERWVRKGVKEIVKKAMGGEE